MKKTNPSARRLSKVTKRKRKDSVEGRAKKMRKGSQGGAEPLSTSAAFWRKLCPGLHVGDHDFLTANAPLALPPQRIAAMRAQLQADGFFSLSPEELPWAASLRAMRIGVRRLIKRGWPASLLLVYDEVWLMAHQISSIMAAVSGGCKHALDTLAWSVTPTLGQCGFAPHRDRQPKDVASSFRTDGTPRYCTCWVALSHAKPDNSCMYMIPRGADPGYDAGDEHGPDAEDPLLRVFRSSDEAIQSVRALPLRPGGCVIFTHRTMHWGSKGQSDCSDARVSIAFGFSDYSFEECYFGSPDKWLPFPPLPMRIALASAQLINYHERFDFGLPLLRRFGATFNAHKPKFSKGYAEKTASEYMAACIDLTARSKTAKNGKATGTGRAGDEGAGSASTKCKLGLDDDEADDDDRDADGALDDALDAMLDAQAAADGNLFDDFDEDCADDSDE